jgi:cell division protein FtsB
LIRAGGLTNLMHVNLGIWDKLNKLVVFLLVLSALLAVAIWYVPLIKQNERMRQHLFKIDAQTQEEERASRKLRASVESFSSDRKTVERLVRETLGYARPDETIIHFDPPAPAPRR